MRPLKNFFTETAQHYSLILHTNSPWECVIKVCSNGGATYTWVCVIKVCSSGYNYNVKLYDITIIMHKDI